MLFQGDTDGPLIIERNLGIGDDGRRKKGMCHPALRTANPAYPQPYRPVVLLNQALIVPMNAETGGMATGTGETVQLERIDHRIIEGLRKLIAITEKDGYHNK